METLGGINFVNKKATVPTACTAPAKAMHPSDKKSSSFALLYFTLSAFMLRKRHRRTPCPTLRWPTDEWPLLPWLWQTRFHSGTFIQLKRPGWSGCFIHQILSRAAISVRLPLIAAKPSQPSLFLKFLCPLGRPRIHSLPLTRDYRYSTRSSNTPLSLNCLVSSL